MKNLTLIIIALFLVIACEDDKQEELPITNETQLINVTLDFENTINNKAISLGDTQYTNGSNELYTISELKYIVSKIVLIKANGDEFAYPVEKSYFVINEADNVSKSVTLEGVPAGEYSKIRFGIGVDQSNYPLNGVNNFIPTAQETGMLWNWAAGYKFIKFEGTFSMDNGATFDDYLIHVGSHGDKLDNYKEVTLDLPNSVSGMTSRVSFNADIAKIFDSTNTHSLEVKKSIQVDPDNAPKIATNVGTMFTATKVSN